MNTGNLLLILILLALILLALYYYGKQQINLYEPLRRFEENKFSCIRIGLWSIMRKISLYAIPGGEGMHNTIIKIS